MTDYCKCRYPRPMIAVSGKNAGLAYCAKCLQSFRHKPPHTDKLVSTHTKAEQAYPTFDNIISFERISRGITPPNPEVTACDICETNEYLVFKCPDGLYRCATCNSRSMKLDAYKEASHVQEAK